MSHQSGQVNAIDGQKLIFDCKENRGRYALFDGAPPAWVLVHAAMMIAQEHIEEALTQQTILGLARMVGRKSPADFSAQVEQWVNERCEKKYSTLALIGRNMSVCDILG